MHCIEAVNTCMCMVQVMPYASGPSVRRLSKIATLLLARNYIVMLQRTVDELRHLLAVHQSPHHQHRDPTSTDLASPPSPAPGECRTLNSNDGPRQLSSQSPCIAFHQDGGITGQNLETRQRSHTDAGCTHIIQLYAPQHLNRIHINNTAEYITAEYLASQTKVF